ncbi:hypothetical protein BV25DRAFT_1840317 [Artomyces pyxidatus]|uniref:Uncharacterized protein n=1 Tax=Artomyces pyxidatus TaxID=48021 RepID=A0ACB8SUW4_9AGAM|nr:hypothetical protein BV25DRAFT_1840317 [Artomyces pyxidatus]
MSSREPMWYCHECQAEMRPLMVPDPHCASCNGTFVERIEDEVNDPRDFQASGPAYEDPAGVDPGFNGFLMNLSQLLGPGGPNPARRGSSAGSPPAPFGGSTMGGSGFRLEINRSSPGGGNRHFVIGDPPPLRNRGATSLPEGDNANPQIAGPLMAQYLISLLSQRRPANVRDNPFAAFDFMGGGPEEGRWGDYVFNQEALDQIITQLMENSNSTRPVPATEEVIEKLDRQVLEEGSPTLERDCAVCKEQFSLHTEDPDEQVVVTLPCKHPFHEGCIMPWLKSSGTCPVCRHQLVPQPEHHTPGAGPAGDSTSPPTGTTPPSASISPNNNRFTSIFDLMNAASSSSGLTRSGNQSSSQTRTQPSQPSSSSQHPNHPDSHDDDIPGGWVD